MSFTSTRINPLRPSCTPAVSDRCLGSALVAPTCPHPPCRWMDAPTPYEAWLKEAGLVRPLDFKFAFSSSQEAAEACPDAAEAAAEAWLSVTDAEARLPSTWALSVQARRPESPSYQGDNHAGCTVLDRSPLKKSLEG